MPSRPRSTPRARRRRPCAGCSARRPVADRSQAPTGLRDLWARLGDVLRVVAPGWRVALLVPDPALERQLRLPLAPAVRTANGGLPVRVLTGRVPSDVASAAP